MPKKENDVVDKYVGFLKNYADEALGIAEALNEVVGGLALPPSAQAKVRETIDRLQAAHESIVSDVSKNPPKPIVIKKTDIEAAVAKSLPGILEELVNEAVTKKMDEFTKDKGNG